MKRTVIALAATLLVTAPVVFAQNPGKRNEITVGYGRVTAVDAAHVFGGALATVLVQG